MINLDELIDRISLSKEKQVSLFITCLIIISLSFCNNLLELLRVKDIINNMLDYIVLTAIFLFGSIFGNFIYSVIIRKYSGFITQRNMTIFLKQLTDDEKLRLQEYISRNSCSLYWGVNDGVVINLVNKNILEQVSDTRDIAGRVPFVINNKAFNILKKHPEYLE